MIDDTGSARSGLAPVVQAGSVVEVTSFSKTKYCGNAAGVTGC